MCEKSQLVAQQASPLAAMTLRMAVPDTSADTEPVTPDRVTAPVPSRVTAAVAIVPAADIEPVLQARHSGFSAWAAVFIPGCRRGPCAAEKTPLQFHVLVDWTCSRHLEKNA